MRELKFRVWDPLAQEIIDWEHWNKLNTFYFLNSNGSSVFAMQYTGLKDKNGKEIYEGDVVQFDIVMNRGSIEEHVRTFREKVEFEGGCFYTGDWLLKSVICEVIGNIYVHPHLLKEEYA